MSAPRVVVVDDHPVVREGLRSMLGDAVRVVGEAATAREAVEVTARVDPDVVLLDMQLPGDDGVAALRGLRAAGSRARVLVLSMHDDPARVGRALDAGAAGYLLKGVGREALLGAIDRALAGERVLDEGLSPPEPAALTPVEHAVLRHIAEGRTNREIGASMRWSVATVKKYVQRLLERLGAVDRTQAAVRAAQRGWLDERPGPGERS